MKYDKSFYFMIDNFNMCELMSVHSLRKLVKQKTCFKNPENLSCIDLILANSLRSFQNHVFEMGPPGFDKLTTAVLKQYFPKL